MPGQLLQHLRANQPVCARHQDAHPSPPESLPSLPIIRRRIVRSELPALGVTGGNRRVTRAEPGHIGVVCVVVPGASTGLPAVERTTGAVARRCRKLPACGISALWTGGITCFWGSLGGSDRDGQPDLGSTWR